MQRHPKTLEGRRMAWNQLESLYLSIHLLPVGRSIIVQSVTIDRDSLILTTRVFIRKDPIPLSTFFVSLFIGLAAKITEY